MFLSLILYAGDCAGRYICCVVSFNVSHSLCAQETAVADVLKFCGAFYR